MQSAMHAQSEASLVRQLFPMKAIASARAVIDAADIFGVTVFELDGDATLLAASSQAGALLAAQGPLRLSDRRLRAARGPDDRHLAQTLRAAASLAPDQCLPVRLGRERGRPDLVGLVRRCGCSLLLICHAPDVPRPLDSALWSEWYGLTPRESALVAMLATGMAPQRAARQLGISEGTARTHLKSIFLKLGVSRLSELVWLLLSLPIACAGQPAAAAPYDARDGMPDAEPAPFRVVGGPAREWEWT